MSFYIRLMSVGFGLSKMIVNYFCTRSKISAGTKVSAFTKNSVPFLPTLKSSFCIFEGRGLEFIFFINFSALYLRSYSSSLVSKKDIRS